MLQNIRQHTQGTTARLMIGLIVIAFAGWGVRSILVNGGGNEIADVNGEKISPQELQLAIQNQKRRLFAIYGNSIDPAMLDEEQLKPRSLEALINRKLLLQSARAMGLAISEREIGSVIGHMSQFQVDGVFSPDLYKSTLSQAGFTTASYKLSLRDDLMLNQVSAGLGASEFVTPAELAINARIMSEHRDFSYFTIPREKFSAVPAATDQQIKQYYEEHLDEYRTPESVDLEYIDLTPEDFFQPVEESALREAYEIAKQDPQYRTQYRVSHILFQPDGKGDVDERIAAAQQKLSSGVPFADVAREFSDDVGSAAKGGDLGYTSGDTFPEKMEAAIAKLEPGVVSKPVKTEAGTHLLLVTERKPAEVPSFEDMRAELEKGIQATEARDELLRTVESLKDLTFNTDGLDGPAKDLGLKVETQPSVTRNQAEGLFANPELLKAAFSDDVFTAGHNSDVIELPNDQFVVLRVSNHHPSELKPIDSVRDSIVAAIESDAMDAALAAEAKKALAQLNSGEGIKQVAENGNYEVVDELAVQRNNNTIPPEILHRVFELPDPGKGATSADFISTPGGDATVIDLQRVTPGEYTELSESDQQQLRQSLTAELGNLVFQEYQRELRERAEINIL